MHADAALAGTLRQAQGQGAAAQQHLPTGQVGAAPFFAVEHHLQHRGHTMGERHALVTVQPHQAVGLVAPGVDLLDTQRRGHIGHAPGMHVEHRRDGHVHVAAAQ
ncbi:hypothetical protein D3C75_681980 [compost metagenome]